ncbi:cysteine hydrolase family protein [Bradyrhizobium sp. USDA 3256]
MAYTSQIPRLRGSFLIDCFVQQSEGNLMSQRAVIVIDIQNEYFPDGKLPLVGIVHAAANAARVIQTARARGDAVIHVQHEMQESHPSIFAPNTRGVEINPIVQPLEREALVVKHYPNAFRDTDLKQRLDAGGVKEVVIIGAMSHMCIDATSRAAADYGYKTTILHDACATCDRKRKRDPVWRKG